MEQALCQSLERSLAPWLPGLQVQWRPEVGSTNTELMAWARSGQQHPAVLVAQRQTAGRGRMGRVWHSSPDAALTFSLGLSLNPVSWAGLSLVVGLALAQALHPGVALKWPNDLWWQQRKLAGILIETAHLGAQRYAVVGVGVNLSAPAQTQLSTPAAWVQEFWPQATPALVLQRVLLPLVQAIQRFEAQGFAGFAAEYARCDALQGRLVRLSDGSQGVAQGVNAQGALLVHTVAGVQEVTSSEVSVRIGDHAG